MAFMGNIDVYFQDHFSIDQKYRKLILYYDACNELGGRTERNAAMRAKNVLHQDFSSSSNDGIFRGR